MSTIIFVKFTVDLIKTFHSSEGDEATLHRIGNGNIGSTYLAQTLPKTLFPQFAQFVKCIVLAQIAFSLMKKINKGPHLWFPNSLDQFWIVEVKNLKRNFFQLYISFLLKDYIRAEMAESFELKLRSV